LLPALARRTDLSPPEQAVRDYLAAVVYRDEGMFGGWFKRHHGEVTFFGDHFGDSELPTALLIVGAAAILWKLARSVPSVPVVVPVPLPKRAGQRKK